jgi:hypothetical protein
MTYFGGCHCGSLGYVYDTSVPPIAWPVRACQCSFCRAHGALTTSDPQGVLGFRIKDPGYLVRYRFGLRTADFLLCAQCGVYLGSVIATPRGWRGIININAMRPVPAGLAQPQPMSYEGENELQRTQRRELRWTPIVGEP